MRKSTFTSAQAAEIGGIAYATLGYLRARNILNPSIRNGGQRGVASLYSFDDLVALKAVSELRAVPSALQSLKAVADFWQSEEGHSLIATFDTTEKASKEMVIVMTASGACLLEEDASVLALTRKHESPILHVIDANKLIEHVLLETTLRRMTAPGPSGRIPRRRKKKKPAKRARLPALLREALAREAGGKNKKKSK